MVTLIPLLQECTVFELLPVSEEKVEILLELVQIKRKKGSLLSVLLDDLSVKSNKLHYTWSRAKT